MPKKLNKEAKSAIGYHDREVPDDDPQQVLEYLNMKLAARGFPIFGDAEMFPMLKALLASEDPKLAAAALPAVPFLKDVSMASDLVAAWERHVKVPGFTDKCGPRLRTLLLVHLSGTLRKEHPKWTRRKCAREAEAKAYKLFEKLGRDPAKWKKYWNKVLGTSKSG